MPELSDVCHTCGQSFAWHQENESIHPFNNGEAGATAFLKRGSARRITDAPRGPQIPSLPFDPVVRQALIDKGVLTVEDLRAAEEKIRVVTAQVLGGSQWSATRAGSTDSSIETGNRSISPSSAKGSQSE